MLIYCRARGLRQVYRPFLPSADPGVLLCSLIRHLPATRERDQGVVDFVQHTPLPISPIERYIHQNEQISPKPSKLNRTTYPLTAPHIQRIFRILNMTNNHCIKQASPRKTSLGILRYVAALWMLLLMSCQTRNVIKSEATPTATPRRDPPGDSSNAFVTMEDIEELNPFDESLDLASLFRRGLIEAEYDALLWMEEAPLYRADLYIASDLNRISGRLQVRYTNRESFALERIPFRIYPNLFGGEVEVGSVEIQGQAARTSQEAYDSVLWIEPDEPLQIGEATVLALDFELVLPNEMSGNYGLYGSFDEVLVLNSFLPIIPVYDDDGWDVEVPSRQGDVSYLDASYFLVRVIAPEEVQIVSSGVEVYAVSMHERQAHLLAAGPARDFYMAASTTWQKVEEQVNGLVVNSYAPPDKMEGALLALEAAARALASYSERFGSYPYSEFDIIATPMQALGMEYPGLTAIAGQLYDPDAQIQGVPSSVYLESVIAHEVAHQWFYNLVGSDQQQSPWLDEAMAQYSTWLYFLDTSTPDAAEAYRQSWLGRWDRVERESIPIGLPVAEYSGQEYGAIVYGRGPLFIEALSKELGEARFNSFLQSYLQTNHWGLATPQEFRTLAETECGCDLSDLFSSWVDPS
jgi:hypothetical protein